MPQRLFIITVSKDCIFYIRGKSMFSTVQFTLQDYSVSSFRGAFEASKTKNVAVAIDGTPQGSVNRPVGQHEPVHSCTVCRYCTKFPIYYLNANVSTRLFRSSSIIMCN
jgi:hypothetical protein